MLALILLGRTAHRQQSRRFRFHQPLLQGVNRLAVSALAGFSDLRLTYPMRLSNTRCDRMIAKILTLIALFGVTEALALENVVAVPLMAVSGG